jgi:hypothetical protein
VQIWGHREGKLCANGQRTEEGGREVLCVCVRARAREGERES